MNNLINYIRAGYPGIYLLSSEEVRVEHALKRIAEVVDRILLSWSVSEGFIDLRDKKVTQAPDPMQALAHVSALEEQAIVLLKDFHLFIEDNNPVLVRQVKETLRVGKAKGKTLIVLACRLALPAELEREFVALEFALPDKAALAVVLENIARSADLPLAEGEQRELLLDAATGLTTLEAENAFALSVVEAKQLDPVIVAREKASEVKKSGLLEILRNVPTLENIGGLEQLKAWLVQRKDAFGADAKTYGLPMPKGLLIVGIPGTGKSLTAKATAAVLQRPLLKLDAGRLFASLVGQSESNLRSAIATAEAIAPCVLWIDELEKAFAGAKSSGSTDGGTSSRVFGSFLNWMQDRTSAVFVVATANDVSALPPELLRKGRFDELFFVDLPSQQEREAIWRIQIRKYARRHDTFDVHQLAKATDGLTGAEIEQLFIDALYASFADRQEPTDLTIAMQLTELTPLSKLMADDIAALRKWSKGRARLAASPKAEPTLRRINALH